MSRSLRRGALAASAVVFSIASLAACAAGQHAETLQIKPDNAATTKGDIKIQNAVVITQGEKDKKGPGPAAVSATLFNAGSKAQTLDSVTLPGGKAKVALKAAEGTGKVTVPAGGSLVLGGKGNASAVVEGAEALVDGNVQKVVFQLSSTGSVELNAFVVPGTGIYEGFGPTAAPAAASPSGSPSGTPSGSPSGSPSGAASGSPSGSASGSPSGNAGGSPSGSPSRAAGH